MRELSVASETDAALPDRVEQLALADDPVAIADEVNEQIEHLRLDVDIRPGEPQLLPREVDLEIAEAEAQSSPHHAQTESRSSPGGDLSNSWRLSARLNYTIRTESPRDRPIKPPPRALPPRGAAQGRSNDDQVEMSGL